MLKEKAFSYIIIFFLTYFAVIASTVSDFTNGRTSGVIIKSILQAKTFKANNDTPISTKCGEILGQEGYGQISYKPNETYGSFERCHWTIRIPSAQNISFELLYTGLDKAQADFLQVTTFTRSPEPLKDMHIFEKDIESPERAMLEGNVAVVTFHTDRDVHGTGFILNYEGVGESSDIISSKSRDFISDAPNGYIHGPQEEGLDYYDSNELSTFLLAPEQFRLDFNTYRWNFTVLGFDSCCECDFVQRYFIGGYCQWEPLKRFCNESSPYRQVYTQPQLFVFTSDGFTNGVGFELAWDDV